MIKECDINGNGKIEFEVILSSIFLWEFLSISDLFRSYIDFKVFFVILAWIFFGNFFEIYPKKNVKIKKCAVIKIEILTF